MFAVNSKVCIKVGLDTAQIESMAPKKDLHDLEVEKLGEAPVRV